MYLQDIANKMNSGIIIVGCNRLYSNKYWSARIIDIGVGRTSQGPFEQIEGLGNTQREAMEDYAKKIAGKYICTDYRNSLTQLPHEIEVGEGDS